MTKTTAMALCVIANGLLFGGARFITTDTGSGMLILLGVCPLMIVLTGILYGKKYDVNRLYGLSIAVLILVLSLTLYSSKLYVYSIIYGILALMGNFIGSAFYEKNPIGTAMQNPTEKSNIRKVIVGIVLAIGIGFLTFLAYYMVIKNRNILPTDTKVTFDITNLSEKPIQNIQISTSPKGKCGIVSETILNLSKDTTKAIALDLADRKKLNCKMSSEGSYTIYYQKNHKEYRQGLGYFTHRMPTENHFSIAIDENANIQINKRALSDSREITITKGTTNKNDPVIIGKLTLDKNTKYSVSHSGTGEIIDYLVQYDAGNYKTDGGPTFSNEEANKVREKVDRNNNPFYRARTHIKTSKKDGKFTVVGESMKDGPDYFYKVKEKNNTLYKTEKTIYGAEEPFINFVANGDDWRLSYYEYKRAQNPLLSHIEHRTRLIHNGKDTGYYEAFGLSKIDGKILYFFKKDKTAKIQYYFNGKIYDTDFDEIIHDMCCEPGAYNMRITTDGRLAFRAVIGEKFTYNEMLLPGFTFRIED